MFLAATLMFMSAAVAQTQQADDAAAIALAVDMITQKENAGLSLDIVEDFFDKKISKENAIRRLRRVVEAQPANYNHFADTAAKYRRGLRGTGNKAEARRTFAQSLSTMPGVLERLRAIPISQILALEQGDRRTLKQLRDEHWRLTLSLDTDLATIYQFQAALSPPNSPVQMLFLSLADCFIAAATLDYAIEVNRNIWQRQHRAANYLATADELQAIERNLEKYARDSKREMKNSLRAQRARLATANTPIRQLGNKAAIQTLEQSQQLMNDVFDEQIIFRAGLREASRALRFTVKDNLSSFRPVGDASYQLRATIVPILQAQTTFEVWSEKISRAFAETKSEIEN